MIRRRLEAPRNNPGAIDLGNVIPFERSRGDVPPLSGIGAADRPAPDFFVRRWSPWWAGVLAGSFIAHAGLAALFLSAQDPVPAVGLEAISVEIVLFGADAPAGMASAPAEQEAQPQPSPTPEEPVANEEPVEPEPVEVAPVIPPPDPEAPPRQEAKEKEKKKEEVAPPSSAASGVGRGQSRSDANYNGRVAAHLARHKRFPEGAQHTRSGTSVVNFSLDGSGRLIAVKLIRSSGVAALDQEAQAMVRRASPFPAPPSGGTREFTVPLTFRTN